jgi:hypothetical protein
MRYLFYAASSFNQPIECWQVHHTACTKGMFSKAKSFHQSLEKWNLDEERRRNLGLEEVDYEDD